MGFRIYSLNYINSFIKKEFGVPKGLSMVELGSQDMRREVRRLGKTGKEYFESQGIKHTIIDLNGKYGAVKYDLAKLITDPKLMRCFDVLTNGGTSEHVEPFEGQYDCFKNSHNFISVGGIAIHMVPDAESPRSKILYEKKHCNNFYSEAFFKMLAEKNDYELLDVRRHKVYICVCMKKTKDNEFMEDKELFLSKILRREDGKIYRLKNGKFKHGFK